MENDYAFDVVEKPVVVGELKRGIRVPNKKAIVRTDTEKLLAIVSKRYQVVTHKDVVTQFETALDAAGSSFQRRAVATYLPYNGAKMFRKYTFEDTAREVVPGVGDIVKLTLELANSYDGTLMVGFQLGGYRLKCENGLMAPEKLQEIMRKHYSGFKLEALVENIQSALPIFDKSVNMWKEWRNVPVHEEKALELLAPASIGKKNLKLIVEQFKEEEQNMWGLFQAATWIVSHNIKSAHNADNSRVKQIGLERVLAEKVFYSGMN